MNVDKNKFYLFLRENSARGKSKLSELILHPKSYQRQRFWLTNSSWAETNIKHQKSTSFSIYTKRVLLSPSIWIIGQGQYLDYRVPWKWALQVGHCTACHQSCPTSHESKLWDTQVMWQFGAGSVDVELKEDRIGNVGQDSDLQTSVGQLRRREGDQKECTKQN